MNVKPHLLHYRELQRYASGKSPEPSALHLVAGSRFRWTEHFLYWLSVPSSNRSIRFLEGRRDRFFGHLGFVAKAVVDDFLTPAGELHRTLLQPNNRIHPELLRNLNDNSHPNPFTDEDRSSEARRRYGCARESIYGATAVSLSRSMERLRGDEHYVAALDDIDHLLRFYRMQHFHVLTEDQRRFVSTEQLLYTGELTADTVAFELAGNAAKVARRDAPEIRWSTLRSATRNSPIVDETAKMNVAQSAIGRALLRRDPFHVDWRTGVSRVTQSQRAYSTDELALEQVRGKTVLARSGPPLLDRDVGNGHILTDLHGVSSILVPKKEHFETRECPALAGGSLHRLTAAYVDIYAQCGAWQLQEPSLEGLNEVRLGDTDDRSIA